MLVKHVPKLLIPDYQNEQSEFWAPESMARASGSQALIGEGDGAAAAAADCLGSMQWSAARRVGVMRGDT
jgi:hypothetical protein